MPTINIERAPDRIKVRYKGASKALRDLLYDIGQDLVKEVQEFTPVGWTGLLNGAWYARRTRTGFELVNRTPYADIDSPKSWHKVDVFGLALKATRKAITRNRKKIAKVIANG